MVTNSLGVGIADVNITFSNIGESVVTDSEIYLLIEYPLDGAEILHKRKFSVRSTGKIYSLV